MYRIGVVEDEEQLNNLIKAYIEKAGYEVITFLKGHDADEIIGKERIDLWVIDIMLEDNISGYDLLKKIRNIDTKIPVIFTTARDQEIDRILGLELGSDDYITKPYSLKELVLRINNIIKRVYGNVSKTLYEPYEIDAKKRMVKENNQEINLTTLEFDLLMLLVNNINQSFSREEILNKVWGSDYFGTDRAVDDLVRRLRSKMPKLKINTIYGYGYRLI